MELISGDIWFEASCAFSHCLLTHLVQTAPSQVSGVMKERVLQRSVELSWQEPEHPNGVITEYEIKYYEKVSTRNRKCTMACVSCHPTALQTKVGHSANSLEVLQNSQLILTSLDNYMLETMIYYCNFCVFNFCYTNENIPLIILFTYSDFEIIII